MTCRSLPLDNSYLIRKTLLYVGLASYTQNYLRPRAASSNVIQTDSKYPLTMKASDSSIIEHNLIRLLPDILSFAIALPIFIALIYTKRVNLTISLLFLSLFTAF